MPTDIDVDRKLLFAVLALQDDLINEIQLAQVCAEWAVHFERPLAALLIERGWITKRDQESIERKLERKIEKHGGDVQAALGAVAEIEARDVLQAINSLRPLESIHGLPPAHGHVLVETPVPPDAPRDSLRQPFDTMRFARGQTLRDAIADFHRRRAGKPAERLELQRLLLEPFVKLCQAVSLAQSRGVIHRDLKPENVVLGGHGEVVVIGWGLDRVVSPADAGPRATEEPHISVSSEAQAVATQGDVGARACMAPEQVDANHGLVDARTDVHGLGAILFEMLTGQPPASGATPDDVFGEIRAGKPPKARELEPTVPPPLEAICAKALAHERENRYARAEDVAEDVRRWLVDEPVSVYRDPFPVRVMRFSRRHYTLVTSLAALLIASVIGLVVGVILIDRARASTDRQRAIAEEQRKIAQANAATALRNLRLAHEDVDGLIGEVADVEVADIPQMEPLRKRLLEKAKAGYQRFLATDGDDPLARWGSERSRVRLGEVLALLGDVHEAETSYRHAIDELERLVTRSPSNADFRRDLARAFHGMGVVFEDVNRFQQADRSLRQAIRLREEIARGPDPSAEDRQSLAESRYELGALLARHGAGRGQEAACGAALEVQQRLLEQYAVRPIDRTTWARYRINLATLQNAVGHPDDAEKTLRATLALLSPLIQGPQALAGARWQFSRASNSLGALLLGQRREDAGQLLSSSRDILAKLASEFPAIARYSQELASVDYNLGLMAQYAGRPREAVASFQESARLIESLSHRFPEAPAFRLNLAMTNVALCESLAKTTPAEAEMALRRALAEETAVVARFPDVPEYQSILGRGHYQLAKLLRVKNPVTYRPLEAVHQAEEAQRLLEKVLLSRPDSEIDQRALADDQGILALALIDVGRLPEAAATAARLPKTLRTDPAAFVHAAALIIKCAGAASRAPGEPGEEFLVRAVAILREGVRSNVIRSPATLELPDLHPLHNRDDFNALRRSLAQSPRTG